MVETNIGILDSGIGALPILNYLNNKFSGKKFYYLGDNDNAPYGNKSINELKSLTLNNLIFLKQFNIELLIVGCNTLSVNLLKYISNFIKIKTFGTFPPVEYALINNKKTLLFSTISTACNYKNTEKLTVVGLKDLARDIEDNVFDLSKIDIFKHLGLLKDEKLIYDNVVLGCTHYDYVKKKFFAHLKPQNLFNSVDFVCKSVEKYFESKKSLDNLKGNEIFFVGNNSLFNEKIFYNVVKNEEKK